MRALRDILFACLLAACATTGTASLKDLPLEWPPLGTTKQEVLARLGSPSSQSVTMIDGRQSEIWGYDYGHGEVSPLLFVPFVGLLVAASGQGIHAEGKVLLVTFDHEGKVISRSASIRKVGSPPAGPTSYYRGDAKDVR